MGSKGMGKDYRSFVGKQPQQTQACPVLQADLFRWHQDIDPSNILVVSRGGSSNYDCDFKIADLGLSHFKRYASSPENDVDKDTFGTSAYGQSFPARSHP